MNSSTSINATSHEGSKHRYSESMEILNGKAKDPMAFLKTCARKEGISFNDRIWTKIEEIVESYVT